MTADPALFPYPVRHNPARRRVSAPPPVPAGRDRTITVRAYKERSWLIFCDRPRAFLDAAGIPCQKDRENNGYLFPVARLRDLIDAADRAGRPLIVED